MPNITISGEFLGSNDPERANKCRKFAAEAHAFATAVNPERREAYLDLKRQWNNLADEIERAPKSEGQLLSR